MNLSKIKTHLSQDPVLGGIISKINLDLDTPLQPDVYHALIRSIIGQQLSVKAAQTIYERFLNLFNDKYPDKDVLLSMDIVKLREKGLSQQKANYVKNIAFYFSDPKNKDIPWASMDNEAIIKQLTSIKGVGRWTVEMILMFELNRPDILPLGDLGIQKGMISLYDIEYSDKKVLFEKMEKIATAWSPYRTIASRYIWASGNL